jgi:hypothetical protein
MLGCENGYPSSREPEIQIITLRDIPEVEPVQDRVRLENAARLSPICGTSWRQQTVFEGLLTSVRKS